MCVPHHPIAIGLCGKVGNYVQTFRDSNNCTNFQVAWLRATDQTVLALQDLVVSHNNRISISHEGMHTFRLRIKQIRESDKGCYMCQINSSPMKKEIGCIDVQGKHFRPNRCLYLKLGSVLERINWKIRVIGILFDDATFPGKLLGSCPH